MTTISPPLTALPRGATLFIGGSWRSAGDSYERFDPSDLTREPLAVTVTIFVG